MVPRPKANAGAAGQGSRRSRRRRSRSSSSSHGLETRVFEVPLPASVYSGLAAGEKTLFFVDEGSNAAGQPKLQAVEVRNRNVQAKTVMEDVRNFELSADGKKLLVRKGGDIYVIDAGTAQPTEPDPGRAPGRSFQVDLLRRSARGVAADVRRRLAHGARLLLRPQPPQRRLPGPARAAQALRRARQRPGRAQRPPGPSRRRALGPAHLRPRRRPEAAGRTACRPARSARAWSATRAKAATASSTSSGRTPSTRTTCRRSASRCRPSAKARSYPASTASRP
ncbi:MAG: hypothetical protein M0C28_02175 [Candidatus Moduliflexus flocculans]|nr:hypothetical protein [Candidatus Moduliflexus flocculans]